MKSRSHPADGGFIRKQLKLFSWMLKYFLPLALLVCVAAPFYGHLVHWAPADEVLARYEGDAAWMVGAGYRSGSTTADWKTTTWTYRERVYIVFPSTLGMPRTVRIGQTNDEPYRVSEDPYGGVGVFTNYGLFGFGVWWFWSRKRNARSIGPIT